MTSIASFEGLTAVVTGGGNGIGRGIALAFARAGAHVAVLDVQAEAAASAAKALGAEARAGARAIGLACDVTSAASLDAARDAVLDAFGAVHVLSTNAGVVLPQSPMDARSEDDWRYVFEVNVFGIVASVRTFLPALRAARGRGEPAHVVNTSSMAGLLAFPGLQVGIYTASKMACAGYTEILRGELAAEGIGVSSLCPGFVLTELSATSARNRPARFGGPSAPPAGEVPEALRATALQPEQVGPIVLDGIRANRAWIFTDRNVGPAIE
ncbi:MAG: SDR family NAD(P)-dependent oxidoreductase, partial [Myxococcales bacterium]|nr:SDR family NAD(P)-dependent oxidoreductase [Myxococcales bacterium]